MIIYSDLAERVKTADFMGNLIDLFERFVLSGFTRYDLAVELLIDYSDLETALTDSICREEELYNREIKILRRTGELVARLMMYSWKDLESGIPDYLHKQIRRLFNKICSFSLPVYANIKVPEGYAFYGYYPETYIDAAEKFISDVKPESAVIIGLRSIGTSFSSVVSAVLNYHNIPSKSFTVRPRGDYLSRAVYLSRKLKREITQGGTPYFLLVDEGPGLSGSSFGVTAECLSHFGVPDDRIIFISSWNPAPEGLITELGRERWKVHRKYYSDFDSTWISSGKLFRFLPFKFIADISRGKWRSLFYSDQSMSPAVYPAEERRKFLCSDNNSGVSRVLTSAFRERKGKRGRGEIYQLKFTGLGRYGRKYNSRAFLLSGSGLIPPALNFTSGFLISRFEPGTPLSTAAITYNTLSRAAEYLTFINNRFPVMPSRNFDEMFLMILENVSESLGPRWGAIIQKYGAQFEKCYSHTAVQIDGHMFPYEWISSGDSIFKTDGLTHHADQFFPGCQDICWDLAGYIIESELGVEKESFLLQRFSQLSGDKSIPGKIGFYKLAYLAFRLGHSSVASDILSVSADGSKVRKQTWRYAAMLKRVLLEQVF
ncbi:MAG: hypothetical protein ACM3Q2_03090 [Syntrophothermus sp.]